MQTAQRHHVPIICQIRQESVKKKQKETCLNSKKFQISCDSFRILIFPGQSGRILFILNVEQDSCLNTMFSKDLD